jgi:hypothetical protein
MRNSKERRAGVQQVNRQTDTRNTDYRDDLQCGGPSQATRNDEATASLISLILGAFRPVMTDFFRKLCASMGQLLLLSRYIESSV